MRRLFLPSCPVLTASHETLSKARGNQHVFLLTYLVSRSSTGLRDKLLKILCSLSLVRDGKDRDVFAQAINTLL